MTVSTAAGAVFAGGRSSRFGADKFLYPWLDSTLGATALSLFLELGLIDRLVVSPNAEHDTAGTRRVCGRREGEGPLGALVDTLERVEAERLLTLPCDVPLLRVEDLRLLLGALDDPEVDVSIADGDAPHWTIAAWRVSRCLGPLRDAHAAGERALHRALSDVRVQPVALPEHRLLNVNSTDDFRRAQARSVEVR